MHLHDAGSLPVNTILLYRAAALPEHTAAGARCGLALHGACWVFPISFLAFTRRLASWLGVLGGQPRCRHWPEEVASRVVLGRRAVTSPGNGN